MCEYIYWIVEPLQNLFLLFMDMFTHFPCVFSTGRIKAIEMHRLQCLALNKCLGMPKNIDQILNLTLHEV